MKCAKVLIVVVVISTVVIAATAISVRQRERNLYSKIVTMIEEQNITEADVQRQYLDLSNTVNGLDPDSYESAVAFVSDSVSGRNSEVFVTISLKLQEIYETFTLVETDFEVFDVGAICEFQYLAIVYSESKGVVQPTILLEFGEEDENGGRDFKVSLLTI